VKVFGKRDEDTKITYKPKNERRVRGHLHIIDNARKNILTILDQGLQKSFIG